MTELPVLQHFVPHESTPAFRILIDPQSDPYHVSVTDPERSCEIISGIASFNNTEKTQYYRFRVFDPATDQSVLLISIFHIRGCKYALFEYPSDDTRPPTIVFGYEVVEKQIRQYWADRKIYEETKTESPETKLELGTLTRDPYGIIFRSKSATFILNENVYKMLYNDIYFSISRHVSGSTELTSGKIEAIGIDYQQIQDMIVKVSKNGTSITVELKPVETI